MKDAVEVPKEAASEWSAQGTLKVPRESSKGIRKVPHESFKPDEVASMHVLGTEKNTAGSGEQENEEELVCADADSFLSLCLLRSSL